MLDVGEAQTGDLGDLGTTHLGTEAQPDQLPLAVTERRERLLKAGLEPYVGPVRRGDKRLMLAVGLLQWPLAGRAIRTEIRLRAITSSHVDTLAREES